MPTITVKIDSGDTPTSVTLLALFDMATGTPPAGVTLPATFSGTGPYTFPFTGSASRYAYTYALNYTDGPAATDSDQIAGDLIPTSGITTIEGAIVAVLMANTGVTNITNRIHPFTDPQTVARPKVTYTTWGTNRSAASGGNTNDGPTGYAQAKMFIDAHADDLLTARRLSSAIRKALNGYSGTVGGFTIAAVYINDERQTSLPDQLAPGNEKPTQRFTLDCRVTYIDP